MAEVRAKIAGGGRVVIPAQFRKELGLHTGDEVVMRVEDGELRILSVRQAIRRAQELVRRYIPEGRSLVDDLIAERRREADRE